MKTLTQLVRNSLLLGVPVLIASSCPGGETGAPAVNTAGDSIASHSDAVDSLRFKELTLADYNKVADEMGISTACIRAVVDIEAGPKAVGFNPDSTVLINFDLSMFRQAARRYGIDLNKYKASHSEVFAGLKVNKYGSRQAAQYARLRAAMEIDTVCALEATFWGMFQIGGFNWKLCDCESVFQFVERMSYSELEQLELFAAFCRARKLDVYLQRKDWAAFSLRYNGPGYKKRGYDRRMAAAYSKYSK